MPRMREGIEFPVIPEDFIAAEKELGPARPRPSSILVDESRRNFHLKSGRAHTSRIFPKKPNQTEY